MERLEGKGLIRSRMGVGTPIHMHFPGKGPEIFAFDERGRTFKLPANADQNPLDVIIPAGETIRGNMAFNLPSDVQRVFVSAKYRPYTFQSLLPGDFSLAKRPDAALVQIQ